LYFQNDEITTGQLNNKTEIKINFLTGQLPYFHDEKRSFIDLKKDNILEKLKKNTSKQNLELSSESLKNVSDEELQSYHDFAKKATQILELFRMNLRGNFTLIHLWHITLIFLLNGLQETKMNKLELGYHLLMKIIHPHTCT
jgi:hypothetical protein